MNFFSFVKLVFKVFVITNAVSVLTSPAFQLFLGPRNSHVDELSLDPDVVAFCLFLSAAFLAFPTQTH